MSPNSTGSGYLLRGKYRSSNILRMDQSLSTSTIINFSYSSDRPSKYSCRYRFDSRDNLFITDINDRVYLLHLLPLVNLIIIFSWQVLVKMEMEQINSVDQKLWLKTILGLPNLVIADSGIIRVVSTNPFMQSRQNSGNGLDCNNYVSLPCICDECRRDCVWRRYDFYHAPCPSSNGVGGGGDDDEIEGCTDIYASNFNTDATVDDGSCQYDDISGCTNPSANNYDMTATVDDGSCSFVGGGGNDDIPGLYRSFCKQLQYNSNSR